MKKLEKKLGRFAIPNLYFYIIGCFIIGYILRYLAPYIYDNLTLIPYKIVIQNQYWRLFTWFFTMPFSIGSNIGINLIFLPISLFFYYICCKRLELTWGSFQFNLYVFGGWFLTTISILITSFIQYKWSSNAAANISSFIANENLIKVNDYILSDYVSLDVTYYMLISIFLAFTVIFGDGTVYLYFIIPIKMRWLGYLDLLWLGFYFITGDIFSKVAIASSVVNYFIYYFINRNRSHATIKDLRRKSSFNKKVRSVRKNQDGTYQFPGSKSNNAPKIIQPGFGNPNGITIHKCAVCGRTEKSDPNLEFRFCSKCNGNYEYCMDHLYSHEHVK